MGDFQNTSMSLFSYQKQILYDISTITSIVVAIIVTYVCLKNGIYEVFPYFYLIPVVLIAYTRPKFGIYGTVLIGWLYFVLVYFWEIPDSQLFTLATIRFYLFVSIGVLVSVFSQEYWKGQETKNTLYNHSQAGIFSINTKTLEITDVNRKFAQMIGCECGDLIKKNLSSIISGSAERKSFLAKLDDFSRVEDIEVYLSGRDGLGRWALISASHIDEENIVCTVVDINDQKETQHSLMLANRKLHLLSTITRHDIFNKLTSTYGYLDLLRLKCPDPVPSDYISKLEDTTKEIQNLIAETQVYQDLGTQEPLWLELDKLTKTLRVPATVALNVNLKDVEVLADPMLKKVFSNLLDNSFRHGEHVTEIRVSFHKSDEDLVVVWEDNGIGIADDEKERIFDWGFGKNTGHGMFLIREILSLTNITIKETGESRKGARFEITVPRGSFRM